MNRLASGNFSNPFFGDFSEDRVRFIIEILDGLAVYISPNRLMTIFLFQDPGCIQNISACIFLALAGDLAFSSSENEGGRKLMTDHRCQSVMGTLLISF